MDIQSLLTGLARKRPVFHSEADFQHALAWEIHLHYPDSQVRLEYRPAFVTGPMYLDLWVILADGRRFALELKYKTNSLVTTSGGEEFSLRDQGAQDTGRYDFLKDVSRLERLVAARPEIKGFAVLITNDSLYWRASRSGQTVDIEFHLHHGRKLSGQLGWGAKASVGTMRSREEPIGLKSSCDLSWEDYSQLGVMRNGLFRCLIVAIQPGHAVGAEGGGESAS